MATGHHTNCGNWDYETHPGRDKVRVRSEALVRLLQRYPRLARRNGIDTRKAHRFLFSGMAPRKCPDFAGNYRGYIGCKYLRRYTIGVGASDPLVGEPYPPNMVAEVMAQFEAIVLRAEAAFEAWRASHQPKPSDAEAVARFLAVACLALEKFLTIHPYANGNGHCGRLLTWGMFARQGFIPLGLPLDERPPYDQALWAHRRGDTIPLQVIMLQALKSGFGPAAAVSP